MAKTVKVRSLPHRGRQVSVPRPETQQTNVRDTEVVHGNVVRFNEDGVAEVTEDQAEFLVYQFDSAEVVEESKSKSAKSG